MGKPYLIQALDRRDVLLAALAGAGALAVYVRTLAPDILYSDSAEFQTLAYTLGDTHSTGYPVYLLLARLVGFLPIRSPAWRINLFSAIMGALTVAGIYLLARMLTSSRVGALLGCIALALSYTMWSQAIIAEVYTPGSAFLVWILLLVLVWHQAGDQRRWALFLAALLSGLSLGVHATTALAASVAAGFVLLRLILQRAGLQEWKGTLFAGLSGLLVGLMVWLAAFLYTDWHNPPSSFIRVMLYPSRSFWNLSPEQLNTPLKRIFLTLDSVQWKDALFEGGASAAQESMGAYFARITGIEFSVWFFLLGLYGLWVVLRRLPWQGGYLLATFLVVFFYVNNYHPGDQYVFFLSTYLPLAGFAGEGIGTLIEQISQAKPLVRRNLAKPAALLVTVVMVYLIFMPTGVDRLPALQKGIADFVSEDYPFPVENLQEPRILSNTYLDPLPQDALVLMEWRALYSVAYLAYVEKEKPGIQLFEAMPRGNNGKIADSLVEEIKKGLEAGHPVYTQQRFPGLDEQFDLHAWANRFYQVMLKE